MTTFSKSTTSSTSNGWDEAFIYHKKKFIKCFYRIGLNGLYLNHSFIPYSYIDDVKLEKNIGDLFFKKISIHISPFKLYDYLNEFETEDSLYKEWKPIEYQLESNEKESTIEKNQDYSSNTIEKFKLNDLIHNLKYSTYTELNLKSKNISDHEIRLLSESLKSNKTLKIINLSNNNLTYSGAEALRDAIKINSTLEVLDLSINHIESIGTQLLCEILVTNTKLKELNLEQCKINYSGAIALNDLLLTNHTLEKLNLKKNAIGKNGAKILSKSLKRNSTLKSINLSSNKIGAIGARSLIEALKYNISLKEFYLDNNRINGINYISEMLNNNTCLELLSLGENLIEDQDVKFLCDLLKVNYTLTKLNLEGNRIKYNGVNYLSKLLKSNSTLKSLNLSRNDIKFTGIELLSNVLKFNSTLTTLELESCNVNDKGAKVLSNALKGNTTLKLLNLKGNQIENLGAHFLNLALNENSSLLTLKIKNNKVGDKEMNDIKEILKFNKLIALCQDSKLEKIESKQINITEKTIYLKQFKNIHHTDFVNTLNYFIDNTKKYNTNNNTLISKAFDPELISIIKENDKKSELIIQSLDRQFLNLNLISKDAKYLDNSIKLSNRLLRGLNSPIGILKNFLSLPPKVLESNDDSITSKNSDNYIEKYSILIGSNSICRRFKESELFRDSLNIYIKLNTDAFSFKEVEKIVEISEIEIMIYFNKNLENKISTSMKNIFKDIKNTENICHLTVISFHSEKIIELILSLYPNIIHEVTAYSKYQKYQSNNRLKAFIESQEWKSMKREAEIEYVLKELEKEKERQISIESKLDSSTHIIKQDINYLELLREKLKKASSILTKKTNQIENSFIVL